MNDHEAAPNVARPRGWATETASTIGWLWGGFSILSGVMMLFMRQEPSLPKVGLSAVLAGTVLLPPIVSMVRKRLPFVRPMGVPVLVSIAVGIAVLVLVPSAGSDTHAGNRPTLLAEVDALIAQRTAASTTQAIVSLNKSFSPTELNSDPELKAAMDRAKGAYNAATVKDRATSYVSRLNGFWSHRLETLSTAPPVDPADIWNRIAVLEDVARELETGKEFEANPLAAAARDHLREKLIAKQRLLFPVLRRGYGVVVGRAAWEQDIEIVVQGSGAKTIRFIGGIFAANRNIASAEQAALPNIQKLRFGRSQYEWYRGAASQYYTLTTPSDDVVGYWDHGLFKEVLAE